MPESHGAVEYLEPRDALLHVRGWMVARDAPFDAVTVEVPGGALVPGTPLERPDVAAVMPWLPHAAWSGFIADLGPVDALSPGLSEFRCLAHWRGVPVRQMRFGYHRPALTTSTPPEHLMYRVAHTRAPYIYRAGGMKACYDFWSAIERHCAPRRIGRLLDWGCGSGRMTQYLAQLLPGTELHGVDIDAEAIAWIGGNARDLRFGVCGQDARLSFPDGTFDVVVAASVFTHLTREAQRAWLGEIRRVLVPGGFLFATAHGEFAASYRNERLPERLLERGIDDSQVDDTLAGVAPEGSYRATFQTRAYTAREWGELLEVRAFREAGYQNFQDLRVLR
ncbi:MAG: class I SAM-dependent methyltransferase [Planctomycetes bacterium]|nr:class I SAM-dependent methyltransferase [Planctomycetota bacterium]